MSFCTVQNLWGIFKKTFNYLEAFHWPRGCFRVTLLLSKCSSSCFQALLSPFESPNLIFYFPKTSNPFFEGFQASKWFQMGLRHLETVVVGSAQLKRTSYFHSKVHSSPGPLTKPPPQSDPTAYYKYFLFSLSSLSQIFVQTTKAYLQKRSVLQELLVSCS